MIGWSWLSEAEVSRGHPTYRCLTLIAAEQMDRTVSVKGLNIRMSTMLHECIRRKHQEAAKHPFNHCRVLQCRDKQLLSHMYGRDCVEMRR